MPVLMEENPFLDPDEEEPGRRPLIAPLCRALVAREARRVPTPVACSSPAAGFPSAAMPLPRRA